MRGHAHELVRGLAGVWWGENATQLRLDQIKAALYEHQDHNRCISMNTYPIGYVLQNSIGLRTGLNAPPLPPHLYMSRL